ncbi:MAG: hypothetical protein HW383_742 [Candidatus Magasanikbacteria bacterium]|nr:hypothetical protein [Candidatus Magasanikbacteria bacterium]
MPRKRRTNAIVLEFPERAQTRRVLPIVRAVHSPSPHLLNLRKQSFSWQELPNEQKTPELAPLKTAAPTTQNKPAKTFFLEAPSFAPLPPQKISAPAASATASTASTASVKSNRRQRTYGAALTSSKFLSSFLRKIRRALAKINFPSFQSFQFFPRFQFIRREWQRAVVSIAVISLIFVTPLHAFSLAEQAGAIFRLANGENPLNDLIKNPAGLTSNNFEKSLQTLNDARAAMEELAKLSGPVSLFSPKISGQIKSGSHLTNALATVSDAGRALLAALKNPALQNRQPSEKFALLLPALANAAEKLKIASTEIDLINPTDVPEKYRQKFILAKTVVTSLSNDLRLLTDHKNALLALMGHEHFSRYLVVFQNSNEIRPTGGFIGSFALVDVDRGAIKNIEIPHGGSYDLQGSERAAVVSPSPLHIVNPRWEFQDANWFPDFALSAQKLAWFFAKSGGPTVDGVIAINSGTLSQLLDAIGPIPMPEYNVTLTSANAVAEIQKQVEILYDKKQNKPKKFLADLAPRILSKLKNADAAVSSRLVTELMSALTTHDVQIWNTNPQVQKMVESFGWGGRVKEAPQDFLMIVHANIGSQKTDGVMKTAVNHEITIADDGIIEDTVTMTRTHTGDQQSELVTVPNIDYVRFYVPLGATLLNAKGFTPPTENIFSAPEKWYVTDADVVASEKNSRYDDQSGTAIGSESGKTVFGNWITTKPGETSIAQITYRLPFRAFLPSDETWTQKLGLDNEAFLYTLLTQTQSGLTVNKAVTSIRLPKRFTAKWLTPKLSLADSHTMIASGENGGDQFVGLVAGE